MQQSRIVPFITLGRKRIGYFMSKLKRKFVLCMHQCKDIYNFLSFVPQFIALVLCIKTVLSQFVHRRGLSFSNILHLSSPLRTGKPVGLIAMGIKALELLTWLAKEDRLLNPRALECGLLRFWQGWLPQGLFQPSLKFCNSPTHLPHVFVSE